VVPPVAAQEIPPDIVAISGRELPRLLGIPPAEIVALAARDGQLHPVRVQIDRRQPDSSGGLGYVFETGTPPTAAVSEGLDADDLVLLALAEGGERAASIGETDTEIEVVDASPTESRWFYIRRGTPAPLPPLVSYDAQADRIDGSQYVLGFGGDGAAVIDTLVLGDTSGPNILDRSKARLDVDLALGIGHISRNEGDVRLRTTGLRAGPLRIIRECEVRGRMLLGLYSPPVRDNFIFYSRGFVLPTTVRLTPAARMLSRNVTLRISMDLNGAATGLRFQSAPEVPAPIPIDGRGGRRGGERPIDWYLLRHGAVGLLGWLEARPDVARDVSLYYVDDARRVDSPERVPGEWGNHGFRYHAAGSLPAGEVRLVSHGWVVTGSELEDPGAVRQSFSAPPAVRVH